MATHPSSLTPAKIDRALVWRYIFAGMCASLDSIGLARFAFTPLLPELIHEHWFATSAVIYLGAANLAGYVLGALIGRPLAARVANEHVLRLMMVLISASFFACAVPLSFSWYFGWRFVSGIAGGVVMVLVAATILPHVPPARKGAAGGAIFLGLGLGIAASGTVIPLLLQLGLAQTWLGLGIISVILTSASWFAWPASKLGAVAGSQGAAGAHAVRFGWDVKLLYVQYVIMAASTVPTMVFLVDFVARGLGQGTRLGAMFWAIYGVGAIVGPPLYGYLGDRLGARRAARAIALVMAVVFLGFSASHNLVVLGILTAIIGTFAPGMVPLALAWVHELVVHNAPRQNVAWARASLISAGGLAVAAYGFSALFNATGGDYRLLFLVAALMLGVVLLIGMVATGKPAAPRAARGHC